MKETGPHEAYTRKYIERILLGMSPGNQAPVREYLKDKEGADRNKVSSLRNHAVVLAAFDRFLNGTSITTASPEQCRDHLLALGRRHEAYTEWQHASLIKAYLRVHHRAVLPYEYARVLRRRLPETHPKPVITPEERDALLLAADRLPYPSDRIKVQALLWILWDTGMRVGEVVTLRVESFVATTDGLGVLRMPVGVYGQKTGPRDVPIRESVKPIQTWLTIHPASHEPKAPLLTNGRRPNVAPYWPQNVNALLRRLCDGAGIRPINPHLFRHTWATRRCRDKWELPLIGQTLGWSKTSKMHAIYVHLDQSDIVAKLRQEAGLSSTGQTATAVAVDDVVLEARIKRMFRRLFIEENG